jgi:hypothetical protein
MYLGRSRHTDFDDNYIHIHDLDSGIRADVTSQQGVLRHIDRQCVALVTGYS